MKVQHARQLAAALTRAANLAEQENRDEFDLLSELLTLDDAARAELEAAIKRAE